MGRSTTFPSSRERMQVPDRKPSARLRGLNSNLQDTDIGRAYEPRRTPGIRCAGKGARAGWAGPPAYGRAAYSWSGRRERRRGRPLRSGFRHLVPIATAGAPTPRSWHTAVWTGSEMIVWGGITTLP
jgi:hypothetical protein